MWPEDYFREASGLRGDPPPFDLEHLTWKAFMEIDAPGYYWIQLLSGRRLW